MLSREERRELRKIENKQKEEQTLNELKGIEKDLDNSIADFSNDAREELMSNNEDGFELIANSILYFIDLKTMVHNIRVQFQTYVKTAQCIQSIDSVKSALKMVSKSLDKMASLKSNQKDFMKFKRSMMRGQLNMNAMGSMMRSVNPALTSTRSKEDFAALKEKLLMGTNTSLGANTQKATATATSTSSNFSENKDFFDAINN